MEFLPDRPAPPSTFLREALDCAEAVWEESEDGILEILLPGEPELRRATFEPEIVREEPGVELVGPGSPLVEALARRGLSGGRFARAWITPPPVPPPPITRAYDLRARSIVRSEWADRIATTWIFAFWSRAVGEVRADDLHVLALDGPSLRPARRFREAFAFRPLEDSGPDPQEDQAFEAVYLSARREALDRAKTFFRRAKRETEQDLEKESARTAAYYEALIAEMGRDMERMDPQDPRRTAILSRIQSSRADRDRALAQARDRARLRLEVEAVGALGIVYPRPTANLTLGDPSGRAATVPVRWDPILEQFEPLVCPACARPTYRLHAGPRAVNCGCA
jgi:hypothetical protein